MSGRLKQVGDDGALARELKSTTTVLEDCSVMMTDNDGIVDLCNNTAIPYGVMYRNTKNRIAASVGIESFQTGAQIDGKIGIIRSGIVELPLDIDHGAVNVGDAIIVGPANIGRVIKGTMPSTFAEELLLVGFAEEKIAAPGGGLRTQATVKTALKLYRGVAP